MHDDDKVDGMLRNSVETGAKVKNGYLDNERDKYCLCIFI